MDGVTKYLLRVHFQRFPCPFLHHLPQAKHCRLAFRIRIHFFCSDLATEVILYVNRHKRTCTVLPSTSPSPASCRSSRCRARRSSSSLSRYSNRCRSCRIRETGVRLNPERSSTPTKKEADRGTGVDSRVMCCSLEDFLAALRVQAG